MVPFESDTSDVRALGLSSSEWQKLAAETQGLRQALTSPETTVGEVLEAASVLKDYRIIQRDVRPDPYMSPYDYTDMLRSSVSKELFQAAFDAEGTDGVIHSAIIASLEWGIEAKQSSILEIEQLLDAYGVEHINDLFDQTDDDYLQKVQSLLLHPNNMRTVRRRQYDAVHGEGALHTLDYPASKDANRDWMSDVIVRQTGLTLDEARAYSFNATRTGNDADQCMLIDRVRTFGRDRLRTITRFSGIEALGNYSVEQLERVERIASGDLDEIARLQAHDVIVTMVNSVGEYGTATNNAANIADDENGRLVPFEIRSMMDIYRYMVQLKRLGVAPAILQIAAHSSKGEFVVGDIRDPRDKRFDAATVLGRAVTAFRELDNTTAVTDYFIDEMSGLSRMIDECMQPSRGIDDPDIGTKKIVFQACYAGHEVDSVTAGNGDQFELGGKSVLNQIAQQLAKRGSKSKVELYGSTEPIQMARTERGVTYTTKPDSFGEDRKPRDAIRVSYDAGVAVKDTVAEVTYRK